ncbi:MAG: ABC transporter permease [Thermodesulfobacteriota bacterium]
MVISYKAIYVIVLREFKRFFRQKGRLLVTISRPLFWLFIVGAGFSRIIDTPEGGGSYLQYIMPGIVGMTILFSSVFSTISVVWDREFGFLREMLVAPVSRFTIVLGKLLAGTALSASQGTALLLIAPLVGIHITLTKVVLMILMMILVSLAITAFGLVIASFLTSLEGFNVIMNFIVLPMFFLSGALYPVSALPAPLHKVTFINPLSYGVDAFKHILLTDSPAFKAEFPLYVDIIFLAVFAVVMTAIAARAFERR